MPMRLFHHKNVNWVWTTGTCWAVVWLALTSSLSVAQSPPTPAVTAVLNSASFFRSGPTPPAVAPGGIVSIFGTDMGPTTGVDGGLTPSGRVETLVACTQVLFDGIPAPLSYVRNDQINAIVPYAVAGKTTTAVVVETGGVRSNAFSVPVAASAPGIFTASSTGSGQGAILNEDGTYNSSTNPARFGSVIVLYATGAGQTVPPGIDGQLAVEPYPRPELPGPRSPFAGPVPKP